MLIHLDTASLGFLFGIFSVLFHLRKYLVIYFTLTTTLTFVELVKRDVRGFAIGGLSGGEEKSHFWRMVTISTDVLPREKPRYLMGVG